MTTPATTTSPDLPTDASAAGDLCDVQLPPERSDVGGALLVVVLSVLLFTVGVLFTRKLLGQAAPIVWCVIIGLGWFGLIQRRRGSVRLVVHRKVSAGTDALPADIIYDAYGMQARASATHYLSCLTKKLAESGRTNLTIRNIGKGEATTLHPIKVGFEARPLSEKHTRVGDFDEDATSVEVSNRAPTLSPAAPQHRPLNPRRRGRVDAKRITNAVAILLLLTWTLVGAIRGGDYGTPVIYLAIVAIASSIESLRSGWSFRRQWLVAPGGLILRESSFCRRAWKLHLFDRRQSVLIAHRASKRQWVAFVADREMHRQATLTESEAEFLLRAWLSPLRPPPVERLSDLT